MAFCWLQKSVSIHYTSQHCSLFTLTQIWDILKKGVEEGLGSKPGFIQGLMRMGFAWRSKLLAHGMDSVIFKGLFKKKIGVLLGGRQRLFVTGGGTRLPSTTTCTPPLLVPCHQHIIKWRPTLSCTYRTVRIRLTPPPPPQKKTQNQALKICFAKK